MPRRRLLVEALERRDVPAVTAVYAVTQSWGTGFEGRVRVVNTDPTPVADWSLAFNTPVTITSIWDGQITAHAGTRYVVKNAGWNSTLPANGEVAFGFVASPDGAAAPTGYTLNGVAIGGGGGGTLPAVSVTGGSVVEGNAGTRTLPFAVSLAAASTTTVTVQYATADGTATAGSDYATATGTLTFAPGETAKAVGVTVYGDVTGEADETFTLKLSAPSNAVLRTTQATGTIVNDDRIRPAPPVAVADAVTTTPGKAVTVDVLANDTSPSDTRLRVAGVSQPSHGTVTLTRDGAVVYAPDKQFTGADEFTYSVTDGSGLINRATVTVTVAAVAAAAWPARVFAPYVDMTLWPTYNLAAAAAHGKYFTLAFVTADTAGRPTWGGYSSYGLGSEFDLGVRAQVAQVRALGGNVAVSFGGANGVELAQAITSVPALTAAYQAVIDAHGLTRVDFDIEGGAAADAASIARRSQAIAALQSTAAAAGRELQVWFTLPVLPTGLTAEGVAVVQAAKAAGVRLTGVNVMAMDYGDSAAPTPAGHMGDYAIQAATSTFNQLRAVYGPTPSDAQLWRMIGVTPMIGRNDVQTEVFDVAAAQQLLAWARQRGIGMIGMWSLNRDRQDPAGALPYASPTASSLIQSPFAFADVFTLYTGP